METMWIQNIKLETGSYTDEEGYVFTKTGIFHLKVEGGKIVDQIEENISIPDGESEKLDAKGLLAVPTFKEMHNHLDKTYMSLGWKSCKPVRNLKERLHHEAEELVELAPTTKQRAKTMIETLLSQGSTHIRTHVNIDPYIGLKNLEGVLAALEDYKGIVTADIIAFPQHGLLRDEVPHLMKEAMRSGATMVGGLDPAGIDRSIEKSLYTTMDIATEFDADVDIHLHDGGHMGWYTIDKWLDMTADSGWRGRSAISHAFCIGEVPEIRAQQLAERLAEQKVAVMSTIPLTKSLPPVQLLDKHGVDVHFGCDGFFDSWSPHGTGDVLEKVTKFCELAGLKDENQLRKALKWATKGITPLNDQGEKQWPKKEDPADFVFVDAASSAELVARKPIRNAVMVKGKVVYGSL
ncbi:amidohydrolase [Virgibacillus necropolis]|uniref:Deaminase n=1 Tax=Virgibacillus necropolis TaxID=163877 RepID=A0A221MF02_9BACI|nr:amidohydrolase [Virgibacillus necropolis]ASN06211.1 deaminase [Virgibacillus necropolis]